MGYFELALIAVIIIGALSGLVGTLVVLRQRTFFTQALTHATFPGAVAAAASGVAVAVGAAASALLVVGIMVALDGVKRQGKQVAAGIVLTVGFATGVVLQALNPDVPVGVESFLVGSILTVTSSDVVLASCVLGGALVLFAVAGKEILFETFDSGAARAAGYRAWVIELVVLILVMATVVSILPAVGAILAIALIAGPAAAARVLSRTTTHMMMIAPVLGALAGVLGLVSSVLFAVSAGAAIALAAALMFILALAVAPLIRARNAAGVRARVSVR